MSPGDQERFDRIRLARSEQVGPVGFRKLLHRFGSAGAALRALSDGSRKSGGNKSDGNKSDRAIRIADPADIEKEMERCAAAQAKWLVAGDADYPSLLAQMPDAPPVLIYRGNIALAHSTCLAMVGARNASAAACRLGRELARDVAGKGVAVVSGLARGIDTAVHQGALSAGTGAGGTVAVIASGIDIAYPYENAGLQERIAQEGLLIAEQPPGAEPKARHFPYRNRIIAGLSQGTLVVEAAPKSGSLITARLAGDYGRDVMAVPGSPLDPRARGCNELIRDGAVLIQSAADIMETLSSAGELFGRTGAPATRMPAPVTGHYPQDRKPEKSASPADIVSFLGPVPVPIDELIRLSGQDASAVQTALLELELAGRLERHYGGRVALREEM